MLLADLQEMLGHLGRLGEGSRTALTDAAAGYEHTDRDNAARVDATYPPVPRPRPRLERD
jgi:hypothetical protein